MSWTTEFNSVFFISITTIFVGALGVAVKACLKSRCEHISLCCGGIIIDRNVELEANEEMKMMEGGLRRNPSFSEEKLDISGITPKLPLTPIKK